MIAPKETMNDKTRHVLLTINFEDICLHVFHLKSQDNNAIHQQINTKPDKVSHGSAKSIRSLS